MSEGAVSEPDALLAHALDAADASDADLVRLLGQVETLGRRVDAARVRLAGEVAHRSRRELGPERLSARFGCRNAGEVVQRVTGISGPAASRRIRLGSATRADRGLSGEPVAARFAAVGAALAAGSLGTDAAHAIIGALEPALRVADPAHVAQGERELVDAATQTWSGHLRSGASEGDLDGHDAVERIDTGAPADGARACLVLDADDVRLQARVWAEFLDPDGGAPDERDEERRFLTLHTPRHGLIPISGLLLPQVAAGLKTYVDAWTNPKTDAVPDPGQTRSSVAATATARSATAELTTLAAAAPGVAGLGSLARTGSVGSVESVEPVETRSRAQMLHDVLATALSVAARAVDAPSVAGNAPTLVVVAREDELRTGQGVARTEDGTAVSLAAARHVGCAGAIQRITVDASDRIVGIWSPERCFTGPQRRAIAVRDGGCLIPGCHVPATWCEIHHVIPHADNPDGTSTDNGVLLCWHHHRTLDTSGWAIRMRDGLPWIKPPGWLDRTGHWRPARPPGHHLRA